METAEIDLEFAQSAACTLSFDLFLRITRREDVAASVFRSTLAIRATCIPEVFISSKRWSSSGVQVIALA
jgi:hypothetical protein